MSIKDQIDNIFSVEEAMKTIFAPKEEEKKEEPTAAKDEGGKEEEVKEE